MPNYLIILFQNIHPLVILGLRSKRTAKPQIIYLVEYDINQRWSLSPHLLSLRGLRLGVSEKLFLI